MLNQQFICNFKVFCFPSTSLTPFQPSSLSLPSDSSARKLFLSHASLFLAKANLVLLSFCHSGDVYCFIIFMKRERRSSLRECVFVLLSFSKCLKKHLFLCRGHEKSEGASRLYALQLFQKGSVRCLYAAERRTAEHAGERAQLRSKTSKKKHKFPFFLRRPLATERKFMRGKSIWYLVALLLYFRSF